MAKQDTPRTRAEIKASLDNERLRLTEELGVGSNEFSQLEQVFMENAQSFPQRDGEGNGNYVDRILIACAENPTLSRLSVIQQVAFGKYMSEKIRFLITTGLNN